MKNRSIKQKLLLAFCLVTLIPVSILCIVIGINIKATSIHNFIDSTSRELKQVDNAMRFFVNGIKTDIAALSAHPVVKKADNSLLNYQKTTVPTKLNPIESGNLNKDMHLVFKRLKDVHKEYIEVYMGTPWGGYLSSNIGQMPAGFDPLKRGWYTNNIGKDGLIVTPAYMTISTKESVFSVVSAVKANNRERVGVVGIDVALKALTNLINEIKIGETGYALLVQDDGTILANPKSPDMNFKKMSEVNIEAFKSLGEIDKGYAELKWGNTSYMTYTHTSPSLGWKLIGIIEKAEVMQTSRNLLTTLIIIGLVLFVVFIAVAFFLSNAVVRPIRSASDMLKDIAEGEGDLTRRLEINSRDEVGSLAASFNTFVEKLQAIIGNIAQNSLTLDSSSNEILDISNELSKDTDSMSSTSHTVAAAAEEMSANMTSVAAAIEQSSTNISMVSTAAEEMTSTISEIAQNTEKTRESSIQAVSRTNVASENIEKLNISANDIGNVVDTISDISEQTNLLALNATIEAARAGESGKGFAVVANEIKELAKQTAEATQDIKGKIESIQMSTRETISEIEAVTSEINTVNEMIDGVAVAVEEQSVTTQEIASNVGQAAQGIQEVTGNIAQSSGVASEMASEIASVNQTIQNMSERTKQVKDCSDGLNQLSGNLKKTVDLFKV